MAQKLLIIDDSELIHQLVRARFTHEAVEIHSAPDGASGLSIAAELRPDVVLLDVDMPGMDGFEVCRQMKMRPATMNTPIIFLTASDSAETKIRGLEIGATDYITKPFDHAELQARVRASLRTAYLLDPLSRKAMVDALTGLWNRAYLDARLDAESSLAIRSGRPASCIIADIDRFKSLNDQFGHPFGDTVLRSVAVLLNESCRSEDVVCRYGGEEFVILMPNASLQIAGAAAERLCKTLASREMYFRDNVVRVTASFGVADFQTAAKGTMLERADEALYQSKTTGRNRVTLSPQVRPMEATMAEASSGMPKSVDAEY